MKKTLLLLLCAVPLLCGCGSLYAQRREVEQLQVMETLGLDPVPGGVVLSLASSSGVGEQGPVCCSAAGASVSDAMERLRNRSLEEQLFCGHLQHILLGEEAARRGLNGFLATVCRSSDLRLDLPVYVILGSSAREAMADTGNGEKGIADALSALEADRGDSKLSTAGAILRDLDRHGCALVRTVRLRDAAEEEGQPRTVVPEGYGVLVDGQLRELIGPEEALGVALLTDSLQPSPLTLRDAAGRNVTVELQESSLRLDPARDGKGRLTGLNVTVRVRAVVLEIDGFPQIADEQYRSAVTARMEAELSQRIGGVLRLSRSLGADFLGLGRRLALAAPWRGGDLGRSLGPLLPEITLSVTVQGELMHSNDMN